MCIWEIFCVTSHQFNGGWMIHWLKWTEHYRSRNNSPFSTLERGNQSRCTQSNERIPPSAKRPPTKLVWLDPQTTRREEMNNQSSTENIVTITKDWFHVHWRRNTTNCCWFVQEKCLWVYWNQTLFGQTSKYPCVYSSNICKSILHLVANTFY